MIAVRIRSEEGERERDRERERERDSERAEVHRSSSMMSVIGSGKDDEEWPCTLQRRTYQLRALL